MPIHLHPNYNNKRRLLWSTPRLGRTHKLNKDYLISPPVVVAKALDDPFGALSPGHTDTKNVRRNTTTSSQQAPGYEDLLDYIDELLCEYGQQHSQAAPPRKRRCCRRLSWDLHDHARISLKTAEDYAEYASRKRILFDGSDGHPSSPILGALDAGGVEAISDGDGTTDTVSNRVGQGSSEWWEENLVSLIKLLGEFR
jgi:hypothetical protein